MSADLVIPRDALKRIGPEFLRVAVAPYIGEILKLVTGDTPVAVRIDVQDGSFLDDADADQPLFRCWIEIEMPVGDGEDMTDATIALNALIKLALKPFSIWKESEDRLNGRITFSLYMEGYSGREDFFLLLQAAHTAADDNL